MSVGRDKNMFLAVSSRPGKIPQNLSKTSPYNSSPFEKLENYDGEFDVDEEECDEYENKKCQRSRSILEEDVYPEKLLTIDEAGKCLSRISPAGDGLVYAFIQIDIDHRNLTDIEVLADFKYLSLINVSHNRLDLNALDALRASENAIVVRADGNVVESLCLSSIPYLQVLTLNSNRVSSIRGLRQPSLERLELNDNKIRHLFGDLGKNIDFFNAIDCPNLSTLALSGNALETVEQLAFVSTKLHTLYLGYNKIENLNGLDDLPNLSRLHLRANRISNLDGFTDNLKHLTYLNLRENRLRDVNELAKLMCLKSLKTLVVSGNDLGSNPDDLRSRVLELLPGLERIDKTDVLYDSELKGKVLNDNGWRRAGEEEQLSEME